MMGKLIGKVMNVLIPYRAFMDLKRLTSITSYLYHLLIKFTERIIQ